MRFNDCYSETMDNKLLYGYPLLVIEDSFLHLCSGMIRMMIKNGEITYITFKIVLYV